MVNLGVKKIEEAQVEVIEVPKEDIKWSEISLSEVIERGNRLEASVFDVESKHIRDVLKKIKYPLVQLSSEKGFIKESFYPNRFKRIYCEKDSGLEFYLPSQMKKIYPKPEKWISKMTNVSLDKLKLKKDTLLLTRSGTIGNITIVSDTLKGKVFSDDVIRTTFKDKVDLGYTYAYLKSEYGSNILKTNSYGSVITHIEPEHLKEMLIPNPPYLLKKKIHDLVMNSYEDLDRSNKILDEATKLLFNELNLPTLKELKKEVFSHSNEITSFSTKLSDLNGRLEGNYHVPLVRIIEKHLSKNCDLEYLSNKEIVKNIILPGRFTRVYVNKEHGVPFIGGKDLFQIQSDTGKYLSKKAHKKKLKEELLIRENSIILPSRGTLGEVMLAMPHQIGNCAISDNLIQIEFNPDYLGYIFIFLNSEYGKQLIFRQKYGGVVNAIEPIQLKDIKVPILKNKDLVNKINNMVSKMNDLRNLAYKKEQEAIKIMNRDVLGL